MLEQVGAQVMLLRNLELTGDQRMLVNGSRGVVVEFKSKQVQDTSYGVLKPQTPLHVLHEFAFSGCCRSVDGRVSSGFRHMLPCRTYACHWDVSTSTLAVPMSSCLCCVTCKLCFLHGSSSLLAMALPASVVGHFGSPRHVTSYLCNMLTTKASQKLEYSVLSMLVHVRPRGQEHQA